MPKLSFDDMIDACSNRGIRVDLKFGYQGYDLNLSYGVVSTLSVSNTNPQVVLQSAWKFVQECDKCS